MFSKKGYTKTTSYTMMTCSQTRIAELETRIAELEKENEKLKEQYNDLWDYWKFMNYIDTDDEDK